MENRSPTLFQTVTGFHHFIFLSFVLAHKILPGFGFLLSFSTGFNENGAFTGFERILPILTEVYRVYTKLTSGQNRNSMGYRWKDEVERELWTLMATLSRHSLDDCEPEAGRTFDATGAGAEPPFRRMSEVAMPSRAAAGAAAAVDAETREWSRAKSTTSLPVSPMLDDREGSRTSEKVSISILYLMLL